MSTLFGEIRMNALPSTAILVSDRHLRFLAIALIVSGLSPSAVAFPPADGELDSTFGATGPGYTIIDFGSGTDAHQDGAHRLLRQPDGRFVA